MVENGRVHVLWPSRLPDYLTDLNAMHEAEKVLTGHQWTDYANVLTDIGPCSRRGMIHATAAQRAEAFLRTVGKWDNFK